MNTSPIWSAVLSWFIMAIARTILAVLVLSFVLKLHWNTIIGKEVYYIGYLIVGLPPLSTIILITRILNISVDVIDNIIPFIIIMNLSRKLMEDVFNFYGFSINDVRLTYRFLIEPLFTEMPKLLLFISITYLLGQKRKRK